MDTSRHSISFIGSASGSNIDHIFQALGVTSANEKKRIQGKLIEHIIHSFLDKLEPEEQRKLSRLIESDDKEACVAFIKTKTDDLGSSFWNNTLIKFKEEYGKIKNTK